MGQLLEAGTLLNLVRSVQADDTFYDRVVWVQKFAEYVYLLMVVLTMIYFYHCTSTFITILHRVYKSTVLAEAHRKYDASSEKRGKRPVFVTSKFIDWAKLRPGPLKVITLLTVLCFHFVCSLH